MDANELSRQISLTMTILKGHSEELGRLDQAIGDGDLGITIAAGADAIVEALAQQAPELPAEVMKQCAKAFANANPSTMAALVAGGLLAGSREVEGKPFLEREDASRILSAATDSISKRGKAALGDKTIVDAMVPATVALQENLDARVALAEAIEAAQKAVAGTTAMQSRKGRASWLQERSVGLVDPGATAFLRFLESWQEAMAS